MAARRNSDIPTGLTRVLLPGEKLVIAVHAHWARLAEPVITMILGFFVAVWIDSNVTKSSQVVGTLFWWVFFILLARLMWELLNWQHNWFVATDKRLLLRYGLIVHKVAMMPLLKVTDMSYLRSIPGQFLGYGKFVLESAGQDQALREVKWVPKPDETYRAICAEIFHIVPPPADEDDFDDEFDELGGGPGGGPSAGPSGRGSGGGYGGSGGYSPGGYGPGGYGGGPGGATPPASPISAGGPQPGYPDVHRTHNPIQDRLDSYSRALPIQRTPRLETVYESEDIKRRRRAADTGPIWQQPLAKDLQPRPSQTGQTGQSGPSRKRSRRVADPSEDPGDD
ncbi:PH domain-containing protein [Monashia sp. NPDC004114]